MSSNDIIRFLAPATRGWERRQLEVCAMRLFVTGGSGFIGSAVVPELLGAGHQVLGLARSDSSAAALAAAGAEVLRGDLEDLRSLQRGSRDADGVVHLGFVHDFSDLAIGGAVDLQAVEAIGATLAGTGKPFVITTGTLLLALGADGLVPGELGTEDHVSHAAMPRVASENAAIALAGNGVRSSAIRLSPSVHGVGDHGFVPILIGIAREKGVSAFVADGVNRWPGVHRLDAARLFRLAVETAPAGSRWHGVGDQGVPFRDIAAVIGRHLDVPVKGIAPEEADAHFGFLGALVSLDNPTSNALTRERLGWEPVQPGLLADLDEGHYFA
jgi:nucleoside-diphosphate-sugar epimerase